MIGLGLGLGLSRSMGGGFANLISDFDDGFAFDARDAVAAKSYLAAHEKNSGVLTRDVLDAYLTDSTNTPTRIIDETGAERFSPHNYFLNSSSPATQSITVVSGRKYTIKTTGDIALVATNAATGTASAGSPLQITAASTTLTLTKSGTSGTAQVHEGHGEVDYIASAGSAKYGIAISKHPATGVMCLLVEPARNNLLWNSLSPATQTRTLGATTYTLSCKGSGSVSHDYGGGGTATEGSPVSFTTTGTPSVTFTVTGSLDSFQCENGANVTSTIATENATRGRSLQNVLLLLADVPAIGSEWLVYLDCYPLAVGNSAAYFLNMHKDTGLADYFTLRSDGVTKLQVSSNAEIQRPPIITTVPGERLEWVARMKAQEVVFTQNGLPPSDEGAENVPIFTPTKVVLGNWFSGAPPGQLFIRRFVIAPV